MCFSIVKNSKIIAIIFLCYCSMIIAENKISLRPPDSSPLANLTNIVTELLYNSPAHPHTVIILYDESNKTDFKLSNNFYLTSSAIILNKRFSWKTKVIYAKKIDAVILFIKNFDIEQLTLILSSFSSTIWKSPMPTFFIITNDLNNCYLASKILQKMWIFTIISYFICQKANVVAIFTFNPFSKWAPPPWEVISTIKFMHTKWTLFRQIYKKEHPMNQSLEFDRTQVLNGYKLYLGFLLNPKEFATKSQLLLEFYKKNKWVYSCMKGIMKTLNISGKIHSFLRTPEIFNNKSEMAKYLFQSNDVDIIAGGVVLTSETHTAYKFERTFPAFGHQWGILTINRGYKTPIEKIRDFYGIWVLLFTIFILTVAFIVIYLFEQRRIYFATFEIIRLLINAGLYTRMDTISLRLFFTVIFIYFLIIQATFNGNLTNFLTKPTLRRHPETLEDLKELGYKHIYGVYSSKYSIPPAIKFTSSNKCWERFKDSENAACIDNHKLLLINLWKNRTFYYINQKPFGCYYYYFYVRSNWPLLDKVNQALMRVWQSGLPLYWAEELYFTYLYKQIVYQANSQFTFTEIKLDNLTFAFVILGVGLTCAIFAFCIELYVSKKYTSTMCEF